MRIPRSGYTVKDHLARLSDELAALEETVLSSPISWELDTPLDSVVLDSTGNVNVKQNLDVDGDLNVDGDVVVDGDVAVGVLTPSYTMHVEKVGATFGVVDANTSAGSRTLGSFKNKGQAIVRLENTDQKAWILVSGAAGDFIISDTGDAVIEFSLSPAGDLDIAGIVRAGSHLEILDGITAPTPQSGSGAFFIDTADGDLKFKFSNGTVKTITTNP